MPSKSPNIEAETMRLTNYLTLLAVCVLATATYSAPPDLKGKTLKQTFEELLPGLDGKQDAQQKWQDICFVLGAPGNEALRTEACKLMAEKLGSQTPKGARMWLLKQL